MHLNCHSWFSFKYGIMSVQALLQEASSRGLSRIALTDINNTSGCLDFIRLANTTYGIDPVVGIDFRNGGTAQCYVGIAQNQQGFYQLNCFLSEHLASGKPFPPQAPALSDAFFIYPFRRAPARLRENEFVGVSAADLVPYQRNHDPRRRHVALNSATFRTPKDFNAHRLLRSIANNTLLSKLPPQQQGNPADLLLSEEDLRQRYASCPELLLASAQLLEQCSIDIPFGTPKNKKYFNADASADMQQLRALCMEGIPDRYGKQNPEILQRIDKELDQIYRMHFASYFLITWDIVRYARSKGYFYVGRGSGANSIVAYLLRITDVDPVDLNLYFERFINEHRVNPPDFDMDFSWKDRDDVIAYIFRKYGQKHTALLATYNTFQANSLIRELGKVFGLPKAEIDHLAENHAAGMGSHITRLILNYSAYMCDLPAHLSIHAGGVLISEQPIHCYTATSMPPKGFPITQFSMLEAEDVGLYKFDILSQRGLGHIKDTVELVRQNRSETINIHDIPRFKKDPAIKELIRNGKTIGCFYVESPAMRMLLKKLRASEYLDLVAASSIIRPGVASSGMMREYILRFRHPERRKYVHPKMQELMSETFGIMVYQEDVIKVAHFFAGLSLAEADLLRRGMSGKFRGREEFQRAKDAFIQGCRKKGYADELTLEIWRQVESFAGYSFSKGHSASYAVESYQSLFLKAHYPLEFMVGVINNFGGFYQTEYYVHEARKAGAAIYAPCVNQSMESTTIYGKDIYLGFNLVAELEHHTASRIVQERICRGLFGDLNDFMKRVEVPIEQLRLLIRIGALRFTGRSKKQLLWDILGVLGHSRKTKPGTELFPEPQKAFQLPELSSESFDDAMDEMAILGFPLCSPFTLIDAEKYPQTNALHLEEYQGKHIAILGYYVCRKYTRTIKGEIMYFGSFLDQQGNYFDTTHFPNIAAKFPFRGKGCYLIKGKVAVEFDLPMIEVIEMEKIPFR